LLHFFSLVTRNASIVNCSTISLCALSLVSVVSHFISTVSRRVGDQLLDDDK
jgi:hypothetical protein